MHYQRVKDLLNRVLYAGYLEKPEWDVSLRKAIHEPIISFETYQKIQARQKQQAKAPARKDISADFPLRNFIVCTECEKPMSACWSKGVGGKYPYYLCRNKVCDLYGKSIRAEQIDSAFEELLESMQPSEELFIAASGMITELWDQQAKLAKQEAETIRKEIVAIERKTEQFFDRIVDADSPVLVTAYEKKIRQMEEEKIRLDENITKFGRPLQSFEETFRTAWAFLSNPQKIWRSNYLENKRTVLKLAFSEKLACCKKRVSNSPKSPDFLAFRGFQKRL